MGTSKGNWADLPIEILDSEMLTRLVAVEDFIRFGAVCSSWRCASLDSKNTNNNTSFVPWMMLSEYGRHEKKDVRKFFTLSTNKTLELYLPETQGRRCLGSNFGWILTIGLDLNIHLLNPLTRLQISLPPQPTFKKQIPFGPTLPMPRTLFVRNMYIDRFALSTHPNTNHHEGATVMVVCGQDKTLAIARPGDKAWTDVECSRIWFDDVIYFNDLFYAVRHAGYVVVLSDITAPVPVATDFIPPPFPQTHSMRCYLVEMSGHLHLVLRTYNFQPDNTFYRASVSTRQFRVFKLDFPRKQWIELQHLGDYALFLGNNSSFAINHPNLASNCIYFTDDHSDLHSKYYTRDMGLYDFGEKKTVDPIYSGDCGRSTYCTPFFFIPNLH